jgi:hypothetical protein
MCGTSLVCGACVADLIHCRVLIAERKCRHVLLNGKAVTLTLSHVSSQILLSSGVHLFNHAPLSGWAVQQLRLSILYALSSGIVWRFRGTRHGVV